ncbi:hypothetical protein [Bacillus atrophaeus]|uniref:hypothetical protein n=1 Tax=Bacillus atrophaeus TaxID=1452 RepID=UPI003F591DFB
MKHFEKDEELLEAFKKISELAGKFPYLNKLEFEELRALTKNASVDCAIILEELDSK